MSSTSLPAPNGAVAVRVLSKSAIVRAGVAALLHDAHDLTVVMDASAPPDVLLLELVRHDRLEHDIVRHLGDGSTPVVILTRPVPAHERTRVRHLGARDVVVNTNDGAAALPDALRRAARGDTATAVTRRVPGIGGAGHGQGQTQLVSRPDGVQLSFREREVLMLVARGWSNQEIAEHTFLSLNSIKSYIRTGYRKIGVRTRTQAVLWAVGPGRQILVEDGMEDPGGSLVPTADRSVSAC